MKGKLGDKARLQHILDAIAEIERYTQSTSYEDFHSNSMMHYATVKQLEIIGEAANHITEDLKRTSTQVPWKEIIGLRNILIHEYFGIDTKLVWDIINTELPAFHSQIKDLLTVL